MVSGCCSSHNRRLCSNIQHQCCKIQHIPANRIITGIPPIFPFSSLSDCGILQHSNIQSSNRSFRLPTSVPNKAIKGFIRFPRNLGRIPLRFGTLFAFNEARGHFVYRIFFILKGLSTAKTEAIMQTAIKAYKDLTDTELQEILRFRGDIFEEEYQFSETEKCEDYSPLHPDDYDEHSVHFIIRQDEDSAIIAYVRLIRDQLRALPIYNYFPTLSDPQTTGIEISRLSIHPSYRGDFRSSSPLGTLFTEIARYGLSVGITSLHCFVFFKPYWALKKLYNIPLQRLGKRQRFSRNVDCYLCSIDVLEAIDRNQDRYDSPLVAA